MKPSRVGDPSVGDNPAGERESGVVLATRESRRHPRRNVVLAARVSTLAPERDPKTQASFYVLAEARTLDVGDAGAGLEVDDVVPLGRRVMVELELPDGSTLLRRASVMWCATDRDSHYLGLCFDELVPGLLDRI